MESLERKTMKNNILARNIYSKNLNDDVQSFQRIQNDSNKIVLCSSALPAMIIIILFDQSIFVHPTCLHTFWMFGKQNIRTNFSPNGSPLTTSFQTLYSP